MDTVEVPYGGSLDPAAFPEVPSDGGRYGAWAPFDHNHITRSLTVEAVYEDWVTTISSGGERPLLLAEGAFSPDARLELAQRPEPVDGAAAYDYQITDGAELPDTVTLRVCADGLRGSVRAALLQDGSAVPIEAERMAAIWCSPPPPPVLCCSAPPEAEPFSPGYWPPRLRRYFSPCCSSAADEKNKRSCLCLGQNSRPRGKSHGALFHATAAEEGCRR